MTDRLRRGGRCSTRSFGVFYLGVPLVARRMARAARAARGAPAPCCSRSLVLLLFLAAGPRAAAALWGLALLLAILNAGLFIESAAGACRCCRSPAALLSWLVLGVWWGNAAAAVGLLPSLLVLVGLTLVMLGGHAWAHAKRCATARRAARRARLPDDGVARPGRPRVPVLRRSLNPEWSTPPWPVLGALP